MSYPYDGDQAGTFFLTQRMRDDSVTHGELRYSLGGMSAFEVSAIFGRAIRLMNQSYGYSAVESMGELTTRLEEKLTEAFLENRVHLKSVSPGLGYAVIDQLLSPNEKLWETFSHETLRAPGILVQFEYLSKEGQLTVRSGALRRVKAKTISVDTAEGRRAFSQERILSFGSTKRLGLASPRAVARFLVLRPERVAFFGVRVHWETRTEEHPRYKVNEDLMRTFGKIMVSEGEGHGKEA